MDETIKDCPCLGMAHDPQTKTSFPSSMNHCHQAKPAEVVDLSYQEIYCLTPKFKTCPVFNKDKKKPLPIEIQGSARQVSNKKKIKWLIVFILIIVILILAFIIWNLNQREPLVIPITGGSPPTSTEITPTFTQSPVSITNLTVGAEIGNVDATKTFPKSTPDSSNLNTLPGLIITETTKLNQIVTNTFTPEPIRTLTPTFIQTPTQTSTFAQSLRALDTIIGKDFPFIIHRVQTGESLSQFANQYKTNLDAILRINYRLTVPVWAGTLVVIPVGFTDVTQLPSFQPFKVTNGEMAIEDLATQESVKLNDLIYYNGFVPGDRLKLGDWVLIPHSISTS